MVKFISWGDKSLFSVKNIYIYNFPFREAVLFDPKSTASFIEKHHFSETVSQIR